MKNEDLDMLIIEVLPSENKSPIATYVVANKINYLLYKRKEASRINTTSIRNRLKKLEDKNIVKIIPTTYKTMLSWVKVTKSNNQEEKAKTQTK